MPDFAPQQKEEQVGGGEALLAQGSIPDPVESEEALLAGSESILDSDTGDSIQFYDFNSGLGLPEVSAGSLASKLSYLKGEAQTSNYDLMKDSLLNNGESPDVDAFRDEIYDVRAQADAQDIEEIVASTALTPDEKLRNLSLIDEDVASRQDIPIHDYVKYKIAASAEVDNALAGQSQIGLIQAAQREMVANDIVNREITSAAAKLDPSLMVAAGGFAAQAVPGWSWELKDALASADPELDQFYYNLLPGELFNAFSKRYATANPEVRVRMVKAVINAAQKKGLWLDTDVGMADILQALEAAIDPGAANMGLLRTLYNIVGIADATIIGAPIGKLMMKSLGRPMMRVTKGSTQDLLNRYAPKDGQNSAVSILEDTTGKTAEAMGTTKEAVASEQFFIGSAREPVTGAPDAVNPVAKKLAEEVLNISKFGKTDFLLQEAEKVAAEVSAIRVAEEAAKTGGVHVINGSSVTRHLDKFVVNNMVRMDETRGWPSAESVKAAMGNFREILDGASFTILRKNINGEYEPIAKTGTIPAPEQELNQYVDSIWPGAVNAPAYLDDYAAQIHYSVPWNPKIHGQILEPRPVRSLPGRWAKLANVTSQFGKFMNITYGVAAARSGRFAEHISRLSDPYRKLNAEQKEVVNRVLAMEDDSGVEFTLAEAKIHLNNDPAAIAAYNGMRATNLVDYEVKNRAHRLDLAARGYRRLVSPLYDTPVKALSSERAGAIKFALDSETGERVALTPAIVEDELKKGATFNEFLYPQRIGAGEEASYVIVGAGGDSKVAELPDYVLRYLPGHINKRYEATHVIEQVYERVLDGVKHAPGSALEGRKVLKMAVGSKQAGSYLAELSAKFPDKTFRSRPMRELQERGFDTRTGDEYYVANNQMWFSKGRGNEIEFISGDRFLTPIDEALVHVRNSAAKMAFLKPAIDADVARYDIKFADLFGRFTPYQPPVKRSNLSKEITDGKIIDYDALYDDAVAYWDRITLNMGMDRTWTAQTQTQMMIWLGDQIIGNGRSAFRSDVGLSLIRQRNRGITGSLSAFAFIKGIALSPARQLFLQAQTTSVYAGVEHGMKYAASPRSWKEFEAIMEGLALKRGGSSELWAKRRAALAKSLDTTENDIDDLVDAASNNVAVVNSHSFVDGVTTEVRSQVGQSKAFRAGETMANSVLLLAHYGRLYGFSLGETVNKVSAFLVTKNKYEVNNPNIKWQKFEDDIIGETEMRTGMMNDAGRTYMQTGIWRTLFQFSNYNSRALQQLIPDAPIVGALSDKTWSNSERKRLVATQFAIYGIAGYGLTEFYDEALAKLGIDKDDDALARPVVEEGLAGMALDFMFRTVDATGEQTNLDFSSSFAPFSGALPLSKGGRTSPYLGFANSLFQAVGLMEPDTSNFIKDAPGMQLVTRAYEWGEFAFTLAGAVDTPDLTTLDKFRAFANSVLAISPQYNNILTGRMALKEGQVRDRFGRPIADVTKGESWARTILGVGSQTESDYYATRQEILDKYGSTALPLSDKDLRETAGKLHKNLMKITRLAEKKEMSQEVYKQQVLKHFEYLKATMNVDEYNAMIGYFTDAKFRDLTETGESKLNNMIIKVLKADHDPYSSFTTRIMNLKNLKDKEKIKFIIDSMRAERDEALRSREGGN
jgi:hypothetical protein